MEKEYYLFIASDSLGDTAEQVAKATAEQFRDNDYILKKFPYIRNEEQIMDLVADAREHERAIVVFTTVVEDLRAFLMSECEKYQIPCIDLMTPALRTFETFLKEKPLHQPGIIHRLDDKYFSKVEAVEFAVKYDDGKDPRGCLKADVVLLGISRTSKTPLSMYLAHKNIKVANIPLVPEVPVPDEIFKMDPKKIVGLTNTTEKLNEIRMERLKALGLKNTASYASADRIDEEIEYSNKIYTRLGCPVINVANKAIEETAGLIIQYIKKGVYIEG